MSLARAELADLRAGKMGAPGNFEITLVTPKRRREDFDDSALAVSPLFGGPGLWLLGSPGARHGRLRMSLDPSFLPIARLLGSRAKPFVVEHHGYQADLSEWPPCSAARAVPFAPGHFQAGAYSECLKVPGLRSCLYGRSFMSLLIRGSPRKAPCFGALRSKTSPITEHVP